eukprot:GHVU01164697.1.p1 GENE.GHVU01164697.1~~GHVU01164697.1.p1  ORF type:complete len:151 (+),score=13.21 GHVU01164697.1:182-634(+)
MTSLRRMKFGEAFVLLLCMTFIDQTEASSAGVSTNKCTVQLFTEYRKEPTPVKGSCRRMDILTITIDKAIMSIRHEKAQAYREEEPRDKLKLFAQNDENKWKPLTMFAEIKENTAVLALAPIRGKTGEILNKNASFSSVFVCCFHVRVPQ